MTDYWQFPGGSPVPLRDGVWFSELGGACPLAKGEAAGQGFYFYTRHGKWSFTLYPPGRDPTVKTYWLPSGGPCYEGRRFSGVDRWDCHMPPSVVFALVTSKLLWHVCALSRKPPLGPKPRFACESDTERGWELACARERYEAEGIPVPAEWVDEFAVIIAGCDPSDPPTAVAITKEQAKTLPPEWDCQEESGEWPPPDHLDEVLAFDLYANHWLPASPYFSTRTWRWEYAEHDEPKEIGPKHPATHWRTMPPDP